MMSYHIQQTHIAYSTHNIPCHPQYSLFIQYTQVGYLVHVQGQSPHGDSDHGLRVIEELEGFGVEREVVGHLVEQELQSVWVQLQTQGLEEGDIVGQQLLVGKIKAMDDQVVDVVVGEQVEDADFGVGVGKQNRKRLDDLGLHQHALLVVLLDDFDEMTQDALLAKVAVSTYTGVCL